MVQIVAGWLQALVLWPDGPVALGIVGFIGVVLILIAANVHLDRLEAELALAEEDGYDDDE